MKVHEAIASALREQQVDVVFGLVGDANLYMMNSFEETGGQYVPVANESGALLAAAGYHSVTGRLGVASVTHGPGLANTVTSLYENVKHRVPSLLITGDTAALDTDNFQDIDQRSLVTATGALFVDARSPETAVRELRNAMRLAMQQRLPVVYNVPIDYQWVEVAFEPAEVMSLDLGKYAPDALAVEDAVAVLAAARRPLVLVGRGGVGAKAEIGELARIIGAPLATTAQARQLFVGEEFDLGIFGGLATPIGLEIFSQADCIVVFGASLNRWTTEQGGLVNGRAIIHVDNDPLAIGHHVERCVRVHGDAAFAAQAMSALFTEAELSSSGFASEQMSQRIAASREAERREIEARYEAEVEKEVQDSQDPHIEPTIDILVAQHLIEREFARPRTVVMDAGRQCMSALGIFTVDHPDHYVHTISFGSIGIGVPYAIGAAIGDQHRPTLLLCGDGGFMLGGITEFNTAVRLGLNLTVVVFNDKAFGAEHIQLVRKGMNTSISMFDWPDLGAVAESLGGRGITVTSINELERALQELEAFTGVALLNVVVSAEEISARQG